MKKFLLIAFILQSFIFTQVAIGQQAYNYGYTSDDVTTDTLVGCRSKANSLNYGFIEIPANAANTMAGCKITKITFCTFSPADRPMSADSATVMICSEPGTESLYSQSVHITPGTWTEVTLDQPYTIEESQPLYVGYSVMSGANDLPIAYYYTSNILASTATIDPILDYMGVLYNGSFTSQQFDALMWQSRRQTANLCLYATIEGDLPQNAITIGTSSLSAGQFIHPNDKQYLTTLVNNSGLSNLEKYHVTINYDGQEVMSTDFNQSLSPWEEGKFMVQVPTSEVGLHTVKVNVSQPNGEENRYKGENSTETRYLVYNDSVERNVLLEHFTTGKCINCVAGEEKVVSCLNKVTDVNVVRVNHHSGYGEDKLTTDDDKAYEWFFGQTYVWAPSNMIDRTDLAAYGAKGYGGTATIGPVFGTDKSQSIDSLVHAAAKQPAFIEIKAAADADTMTNHVSVTIEANRLYELPNDSLIRINVVLVQDSVKAVQYLADGSYDKSFIHNNVFRVALTGTWGEKAEFVDNIFNKTYDYDMPSTWKPQNMRAVVFFADYDETNTKNCKVYNATAMRLIDTEDAICDVKMDRTYNDAIYNMQGQRITKLQHGINIVGGKKILVK